MWITRHVTPPATHPREEIKSSNRFRIQDSLRALQQRVCKTFGAKTYI